MTTEPTRAERLDHALDKLLDGVAPGTAAAAAGLAGTDHVLLRTAASLRATLAPPLVGSRFEARLGSRLSGAAVAPWILRHPGRLIVTGAVGSAVGVGVTAFAVWRSTRRPSAPAHRFLHR